MTKTPASDTVKELPGYPVQNSPSGNYSWGGAVRRGGRVYDIVWMGYPRRTPWTVLRTPVAFVSYRCLSSQFQFSLSGVTLVYLSQWSALSAGANTATLYLMVTRAKGGGCTPPPSPARTDFSIKMECTPEISNCYSVCTLWYYHTHPFPDRIWAQNSTFASQRMCTGTVCYVLYRGWEVVRWISQSTHRVAIANFWRPFYHKGKIHPGWWGWGVHTHPLSL